MVLLTRPTNDVHETSEDTTLCPKTLKWIFPIIPSDFFFSLQRNWTVDVITGSMMTRKIITFSSRKRVQRINERRNWYRLMQNQLPSGEDVTSRNKPSYHCRGNYIWKYVQHIALNVFHLIHLPFASVSTCEMKIFKALCDFALSGVTNNLLLGDAKILSRNPFKVFWS